ncbi:DEAD/DEAH box helicase [Mucilaginibacter sp.]|jgi:ATP-dependent Lhr-like helicase|uniref:DEAD/DEAH box helicase n=1 Tax=Mucilaginibacter sp. TaxID=1882438 RepID=UPI003568CAB1
MSFDLLSVPIRKYIREKRWEQLRPIQTAAIARIMTTDDNFILASRTASGKTEAAFLPILSKVDFNSRGVAVLYISPLIALINDQFERIEKLCQNLEVTVTKWHGEANRTLKEKLIKEPQGIVLITPESIEAMFVNRPPHVKLLFSNLQYVVIDEIHAFVGTDRGVQLKSLLSRLQDVRAGQPFKIVGLSATLGDFNEAKRFTGDEARTKVLIDKSPKEIDAHFRFFEAETAELPLALLKDLYKETRDAKVLIFPNSRGKAEEVAVKLLKISERVGGHKNYFSHHSSVDKQVREYVEEFAKSSTLQHFSIACTSTLELGIDIGSVDEVVQIDATHSIASLIQRIGRSGRKDGVTSKLFLYATEPWSLLQSLACWLLYKEGFIEPPANSDLSYDILLHQALSIVKGRSGIVKDDLQTQLLHNFAFSAIGTDDIDAVIGHLINLDLLEQVGRELIIGVEGEKIVNRRDFYSAFKTETFFKVVNAGNTIGELPYSPGIIEDENILLAAKMWKIIFVDFDAKKIEVKKAIDGKPPVFFGGGGNIHHQIRRKMYEIAYGQEQYVILDEPCALELKKLRSFFASFAIKDVDRQQPLFQEKKQLSLFTFSGSRLNKTISLLLDINGLQHTFSDHDSCFHFNITGQELRENWKKFTAFPGYIDVFLQQQLEEKPALLDFSKWGVYLPDYLKIRLLKQKYYDLDAVKQVNDWILVENLEVS